MKNKDYKIIGAMSVSILYNTRTVTGNHNVRLRDLDNVRLTSASTVQAAMITEQMHEICVWQGREKPRSGGYTIMPHKQCTVEQ